PVIVITVPPAVAPTPGETEVTVGAPEYWNALASDPDWVSGLVTWTVTSPLACAGVVAVICVVLVTVMPVAAVPPTLTVAPLWKFAPVMVMTVPPAVGPDPGNTELTTGGAL